MLLAKWQTAIILVLTCVFAEVAGVFVGINIGTNMSNVPSASDVVAILQAQKITHVRLFDADHNILNALANTGIEVMIGLQNSELLRVGQSKTAAADWITKNVAAYVPSTNITAISVGSEVLTSIPNAAPVLVLAMQFLHSALVASNLNFQVKISSPHSMGVIPKPFPPSTAAFNSTWNSTMQQYLQFLKNTGSFFMLNAQPYYGYSSAGGIFPIEYALFEALTPNKQIVDPNTLFHYNSMFDSMVDAVYYSIAALNFTGIPVVVAETGWPSLGGSDEPDATVDNARIYNDNLIQRVLNGSGPPSQPNMVINTYIFELFNEDLRPGRTSEKNWGLFFPNETAVYSLSFSGVEITQANSTASGVFCVAKSDSDQSALKTGLDWACGIGSANCTAIQPGNPCFEPNTYSNHASYAYNDYYQRTQSAGGTCNFGNTAMLTKTDPSYGSCVFTGSTGSNSSSGLTTQAFGPSGSQSKGTSKFIVDKIAFFIPVVIVLAQF